MRLSAQLTSLQVSQSAQDNDWHFAKAQLARGSKPTVARNDVSLGANEYRI